MSDPANPFEPPQSTVIGNKEPERDHVRSAGIFLLKCLMFSLVFWTTWLLAVRPITSAMSSANTNTQSSQSQDDQTNELIKKYWEQVREADRLQAEYRRQANQSAQLIEKQDQLLRRFDLVIQRWESQPTK